jgi:hypothetical protein
MDGSDAALPARDWLRNRMLVVSAPANMPPAVGVVMMPVVNATRMMMVDAGE